MNCGKFLQTNLRHQRSNMDTKITFLFFVVFLINQNVASVSENQIAETLLQDLGLTKRPDLKHVSLD